jgi:hypothetical protein
MLPVFNLDSLLSELKEPQYYCSGSEPNRQSFFNYFVSNITTIVYLRKIFIINLSLKIFKYFFGELVMERNLLEPRKSR